MYVLLPLVVPLLMSGPAHAATHAAGTVIENAVAVDVTQAGFEAITSILPALIPSEIPLGSFGDSGGTWCFNYEYSLENAWVGIEVVGVTVTPMDGYLDINADMLVQINDSSDPFNMYLEVACIGSDCDGSVAPFPVTVHTTLALDVVTGTDGNPALDATVGAIDFSFDLDGIDDIDLGSCGLGTFKDILDFLGLDLFGWIVSLVEPTLATALEDVGPQLETAIEDAFGAATLAQDVDLAGTTLHVDLYPSDVITDNAGIRVVMNGSLSTDGASDCVAEWDPGGSLATETDPPDIGDVPTGIDADYHAGIIISDDFANQGLYALWRGGLLCYTLDADAGIPLDTSTLLGVLAGDAFDDLFPEPEPMELGTRPASPPVAVFEGDHDVNVEVTDMGIDLYAPLDYRKARILGVNLGLTVGVDLALDSTTGELDIPLDLGLDELDCSVSANELAPDSTADIESKCASTLGTVAGSLVGGLLPDLAFALPAFGTTGLTDLQVGAAGADGDWLGAYAYLGEVSYGDGSTDCSGCGSTSGTDCSGGGCATGGSPIQRAFLFGMPLAALILMRRRPELR